MAAKALMISVIIPASNEAALIGGCLAALVASDAVSAQVIVVANGCRDETVAVAEGERGTVEGRGWTLTVLDLADGGKLAALNAGDAVAKGDLRAYLDADVIVSPGLMSALVAVLNREDAAYASGRLRITAKSPASRAYARIWSRVPFMSKGVPGCGLYAVNAAGRARWGGFPAIISDDTFVRLQFAPQERHTAPAPYDWPIAEGFGALARVRRRQDRGVAEIARLYPALLGNDDKLPIGALGKLRLFLTDPIGFAVYSAVALRARFGRGSTDWTRSR